MEPVPILFIHILRHALVARFWAVPSNLRACSLEILWFPAFRHVGEALNPGPASESFHGVDIS